MNERTNWVARAYDENDKIIEEFVIQDRTEGEAFKEALGSFSVSYTDWTLTKESEFPILS